MSDTNSEVAKDHESVRATTKRIRELLAESESGLDDLGAQLSKLDAQLRDHFALEERPDGFFDDIETRRPDLANRVARTRGQHKSIGDEITALVAAAAEVTEQKKQLNRRAVDVLDALETHEHSEMDLLQESYLRDFGAMD
jgi:chromosome segregation ATPase